jgi:polyvinyl alcohol dehydrogenase (cytochrome)
MRVWALRSGMAEFISRAGAAVAIVYLAVPAAAQDGAALYRQHCAQCHDQPAVRVPARDVISALSADRIVDALANGLMREQGATLSAAERRAIADSLSVVRPGTGGPTASNAPTCAAGTAAVPRIAGDWNGWGVDAANSRFARQPGLTAQDVPGLTLKWAFGFEGETAAAAQPVIVGQHVFVGSASGRVYALGLRDGCLHWVFKADGGVRGAIVVGAVVAAQPENRSAFFGDARATVYSLDPSTGALRWKKKVDDHRSARISGTPVLSGGRLFVPVSSGEEGSAGVAGYQCCTFRGSVVALNAATGEQIWKTYTIADEPKPTTKNAAGTQLFGPAGGAVWSAPTVDVSTNSLFIATGDAYGNPAAPTTDSVMALDMRTGAVKWARQITAHDAWNMACGSNDPTNCPQDPGLDSDFGQPPMLVTLAPGSPGSPGSSVKRVLVLGQKSGVVHGLDPDDNGRVLWSVRIGNGGMLGGAEWGSATDGQNIYVPLSDLTFRDQKALGRGGLDSSVGGGLFALRVTDGAKMWETHPLRCADSCSSSQSAPAAVIPGVVFSGSIDGHLRAYTTGAGAIIWDVDTAREFLTVNGVRANGGSIDVGGPAIASGMVLTTSGYGTWGGKRGNVLLAFGK